MITDINQLDFTKKYTYADYLTWQFKERVELIKGAIFKMSPAPNLYHQRISGKLYRLIANFLEDKKCEIFHAPFDVRLALPPSKVKDSSKVDTVIQPDITVVCDPKKLDKQGCIGSPNLVIEILSSGNSKREMRDKFELYQYAQIPEYWVISPEHEYISVYHLNKKGFYIGDRPYTDGMALICKTLDGFVLDVDDIF